MHQADDDNNMSIKWFLTTTGVNIIINQLVHGSIFLPRLSLLAARSATLGETSGEWCIYDGAAIRMTEPSRAMVRILM